MRLRPCHIVLALNRIAANVGSRSVREEIHLESAFCASGRLVLLPPCFAAERPRFQDEAGHTVAKVVFMPRQLAHQLRGVICADLAGNLQSIIQKPLAPQIQRVKEKPEY